MCVCAYVCARVCAFCSLQQHTLRFCGDVIVNRSYEQDVVIITTQLHEYASRIHLYPPPPPLDSCLWVLRCCKAEQGPPRLNLGRINLSYSLSTTASYFKVDSIDNVFFFLLSLPRIKKEVD